MDRGAVLFIGIVVGAAIAFAFSHGGKMPGLAAAAEPVTAIAPRLAANSELTCVGSFPLSRQVIAGLTANRSLRVGVFGDSFGEGIGWATEQTFGGKHKVEVYRFGHEGTGFTRYRSLNLLEEAKAKLASHPVDIAIPRIRHLPQKFACVRMVIDSVMRHDPWRLPHP